MVLELVATALTMLVKAVIYAKEIGTIFQQALTRLESTLTSIIPRVNEIIRLNHKLKVSDEEMKELITILQNGQELVNKSSNISFFNFVRKGQCSNELLELDNTLLRYFQTILPLDHFIDTKEMLLMIKELHVELLGAKDEAESSKSKEDESSQEPDEGESSKPKVDEYSEIQSCQDPEKNETVISAKTMVIIENPVRKLDTWTFKLKGCTYNFDLKDKILDPNYRPYYSIYFLEYEEEGVFYQDKRKNDVRNCECKIKHGYVMVGCIENVKIGKSEFEQQMETYGRIGNHPNIVPPFGYCFYQSDLFLFYDSFLEGKSLYTRLHEYRGMRIARCEYPVKSEYSKFSWESKLKISLGVARGISHLHSVKCIHGNLHSSNVLLNKDDGCISDYSFLNFSTAARKSDVHSFGVILLEMVSNTEPREEHIKTCYFGSTEEDLHWWIAKVVRDLDTTFGIRIDNEGREMLKIAMLCVEKDLDKRPEMDDVVKMIQKIQPSSKPKEDDSSQEPDEGESSKPKVDEYSEIQSCQDPEKKDTVIPAKTMVLIENPVRMSNIWTFRLRGCTYNFDLRDGLKSEGFTFEEPKRKDVRRCQYCKHGFVTVSRIEKVKIRKSEFEQQMETSGKIENHLNIVSPFGYCFYQSELFLFYDSFPGGGDLYTRLEESIMEYPLSSYGHGKLNWRSTLKISLGVARGISYLHSVKCIHGNLHSYNVLLNRGDGCISDYGLLNFSSAAKKSDVHSFGVILLRMVSNSKPCGVYFGSAEEELHQWIESVVSAQNLVEIIFGKLDNEEREMLKIAMLCVEKDLDKRPEMDDVVKMIQKVQTLSLEDCT